MSKAAKLTVFLLCIVMIFAWITEEKYGLSLMEYIDYSMPLTNEEKAYLNKLGGLTYGAEENSAPLSFIADNTDKNQGLIVDYMAHLSGELGIQITTKPLKGNDRINNLRGNNIELSDLYVSKERNKYLDFSQTIYSVKGIIATRAEHTEIVGITDLKEKTLAVVENDYCQDMLENDPKKAKGVKIVYVDNIPQAIKLLVSSKVDAIAGDEMVIEYYIKEMNLKSEVRTLNDELYNKEVSIAVNDDHDKLLEILNKGILRMKKDNVLSKIQDRWFGTSALVFNDTSKYVWIPILFTVSIGFVLLLYIWDAVLRRKINLATAEINSQKETLRAIIDTIESTLLVINKDNKILESNLAAEKTGNKTYDEIIDSDISDINIVGGAYSNYLEGKENPQKIGGKYYDVGVRQINHKLNTKLILCKDITTNVISERKLRQENKMTAVGQLSAGLAHEIRNPLGLIRNYKYIIDQYATDEVSKHAIEIIGSSVDRINGLIENLLKFSRLGNENPVWFDLNNTINNILLLEDKKAEASNVKIEVNIEEPHLIYSNEETIRLVIFNLINNALEALSRYDTDKEKKIRLIATREKDFLKISVIDNGAGIKEEDLDNIFNPFFTTKESGTGLGLYIVSSELEKVSGTITVSSHENVKTEFDILIPAEVEEKDNVGQ